MERIKKIILIGIILAEIVTIGTLGIKIANEPIIIQGDVPTTFGTLTLWYLDGTTLKPVDPTWGVEGIGLTGGALTKGNFLVGNDSNLSQATSTIFISSTGLLGIGSTTPRSLFSIQGIANFRTSTTTFSSTGGVDLAAGCFAVNGTCVSGGGSIVAGGGVGWATTTSDTESIYFYGTGKVGIGTTTPWAKLSVSGLIGETAPLFIVSTSTPSATTTAFIVDQFGNVGIGTTNPTHTLEVLGTTNFPVQIKGSAGGGVIMGAYDADWGGMWSSGVTPTTGNYNMLVHPTIGLAFNSPTGGTLQFLINDVDKMVMNVNGLAINNGTVGPTSGNGLIVGSGNVGIGTTTPGYLLTVNTNSVNSQGISVAGYSSSQAVLLNSGSNGMYFALVNSAGSNTHLFRSYGDSYLNAITGNVGIGTTSPFAKLSVAGDGFFNGNLTASNITATGTLSVTGLTTLINASSTLFSSSYASSTTGYFGTLYLPLLGTAAGTFLAADENGKIIATGTPIGGSASSTLLGDNNNFTGSNTFTGLTTLANASTTLLDVTGWLIANNASSTISNLKSNTLSIASNGTLTVPSSFGGRSLTVNGTALDADTELYTYNISYNVGSSTMSTTTGTFLQKLISTASTITGIACSSDKGTSTIMLDERSLATPNTAGTNVFGGVGMWCGSGTGNTATTSFANASMAANAILNLSIPDAQASSTKPTFLYIHVTLTRDD